MKDFFHIKNFYKGAITTIVGIVCIGIACYTMVENGITTESLTLLGLGMAMLGVPDPPKKGRGAASIVLFVLAVIIIMVMLSSCVTASKCLDKFGKDTITVTVRDTIAVSTIVPGDSLEGSVPDSTLQELLNDRIDSLLYISESQKLTLTFWRDKYSQAIAFRADVKPDTIIQQVPVEVKADCPAAVVIDPAQALRWYEKVWRGFQHFSAYLVLAGLFIFGLLKLIRK